MKKIFLLGISLVSFLIVMGCQSKLVKPKKLRTDLLRNSDHVKLNGKAQELMLNDEILSTNKVSAIIPRFAENWTFIASFFRVPTEI